MDPATWEGTTFSSGSTNCWFDVDPDGQVLAVGPDGAFSVDAQGVDPVLIRERTGGNPFFIEEVVRPLTESGGLEGAPGAYRRADLSAALYG